MEQFEVIYPKSSMLTGLAYDGQRLLVRFTNGVLCLYEAVTRDIWDELMELYLTAGKVGPLFCARVKNHPDLYPFRYPGTGEFDEVFEPAA